MIALLPVVLFAAAGAGLGLRRAPIYTASAEINVGVPDVNSQATPGYTLAAQVLASSYSREVMSQHVSLPTAAKLGLTPGLVASRLSSSAVPNSPTFTINATGPNQGSAVTLANAATGALEQVINTLDQNESATPQLLREYRHAQGRADQLASVGGTLRAAHARHPGAVSYQQVEHAAVNAQVAALQAQALAGQYTSAATSSRGAIIDVLNPATTATSDRRKITERYVLIGLAAGVVAGVALAALAAEIRRRIAARAWS
jgi:capsular polysaccharide biosynthesis protein